MRRLNFALLETKVPKLNANVPRVLRVICGVHVDRQSYTSTNCFSGQLHP
jgi:hypothetical protein